jgi:hypothetical protein
MGREKVRLQNNFACGVISVKVKPFLVLKDIEIWHRSKVVQGILKALTDADVVLKVFFTGLIHQLESPVVEVRNASNRSEVLILVDTIEAIILFSDRFDRLNVVFRWWVK